MAPSFIRCGYALLMLVSGLAAGCTTPTGGRLSPPATESEIMALSMMHGLLMATGGGAEGDPAARPTCSGTGADKAHAVEMRSAHGQGDIKDVLPCLQQLYPGGTSGMQGFQVADGRYYTVATVTDSAGAEHDVYFDVTTWGENFIREMRANNPG
jgi:hypothetical protein